MNLRTQYPVTFSLRHGFGTAAAITDGLRCRDFGAVEADEGQLHGSTAYYTHKMIVAATEDVRDGQTNAAGALTQSHTAGNADQIWIPDQNGTTYVVVWVELVNRHLRPTEREKIVYLNRAVAVWATPIHDRP